VKLYLACLFLILTLSGCLINEKFARTYEINLNNSKISSSDVSLFFSEYFPSKGLLLKREFNVVYPEELHYWDFEIRDREKDQHGKYPTITVIFDGVHDVYLHHEEWTIQPITPYPSDYIGELKIDIEKHMKERFGIDFSVNHQPQEDNKWGKKVYGYTW